MIVRVNDLQYKFHDFHPNYPDPSFLPGAAQLVKVKMDKVLRMSLQFKTS
jgi:hypothetical protein